MIDMKKAHRGAKFLTSFNGKTYRENLSETMRGLWAQLKKSAIKATDAINQLSSSELSKIVYGYARNFEGFSSVAAEKLAQDMARHRVIAALIHDGYMRNDE